MPDNKHTQHRHQSEKIAEAPCKDMSVGDARTKSHNAARSRHSGGVQILMCDSSAHFIGDDIDLAVWRAMSTMAGGEIYNRPF